MLTRTNGGHPMNQLWTIRVLAWVTRIISLLYIALDAWAWWDESQARREPGSSATGDWIWQWAVLTHVAPLLVIVAATILGWRRPLYGAVLFGLFALLPTLSVGTEWSYLPLVALPPLLIGLLYLIGWGIARRSARLSP